MPIPLSNQAAVFLRIFLHIGAIFRLDCMVKCEVSRDKKQTGGTLWLVQNKIYLTSIRRCFV